MSFIMAALITNHDNTFQQLGPFVNKESCLSAARELVKNGASVTDESGSTITATVMMVIEGTFSSQKIIYRYRLTCLEQ